MIDKTVWMTSEGYQQLQMRLNTLRLVKRPALVKELQDVSSEADWRESGQVTLLQHELARLDAEIYKLEELLAHGEIVEPQKADAIVDIGETVVLQSNGDVETYTIVSPAESAPDEGRISYESPVGHALLKHKVGDDVAVNAPVGLLHYRIVAVR
jgi:transcription elongation factor GreA